MQGKVVIVTGASSGIGLASVREFAKQGAKVVLAARRYDIIKKVEEELLNGGYEVLAVKTDVSIKDDCKNLIDQTVTRFGKIDVLVNNAGISMRALFKDSNFEVMEKIMNTNYWGTVYCSKYAIPYLIASKGSLVAVTSIGGFLGIPGRAGYSSSKFAIHGLMETIRIENRKSGMHTMLMCPGFTASEIRVKALNAMGEIQGESPRDESHMHTPEYVAKQLAKGIKHRRQEVILTMEGKLLAIFHRVIPRLVDIVAFRKFAKEPNSPFK